MLFRAISVSPLVLVPMAKSGNIIFPGPAVAVKGASKTLVDFDVGDSARQVGPFRGGHTENRSQHDKCEAMFLQSGCDGIHSQMSKR